MPDTKSANHLSGRLLHSGTLPASNYGKSQKRESRKEFIHKIMVVLKELRESNICLKIIYRAKQYKVEDKLIFAINESNELISVFVKSVETAQKNNKK
jgi:four helix bundle protein